MASDTAEVLKENFLEFFKDSESFNLSPTISSILKEIEAEFSEYKGFWSPPPVESLHYLYQLDHAIAECRANKKTFSMFSRLDPVERANETVLKNIKEYLQDTRNFKNNINEYSTFPLFSSCRYPTGNDAPDLSVFDGEMEKIVKWLESNNGFKAIGIHGMCGTGKTTLAKMVLNDPRVRDKYKKPIWVCLYDLQSKEEMDIRIVKEMLALLDDDPDLLAEEPEDKWLVKNLHDKLLDQKNYLIVLDAVWHCNDWFNNLFCVDQDGGDTSKELFSQALPKETGGAVIVTSRQKEVTTKLVREENLIHLKPWDDEKLKNFVKQCLKKQDKITQENIDCVAYHCHGIPFVAATISGWIAEQITKTSDSN
ncbi:probable disease resistance protein At4g19060 [Vigna radiata var. radiata]|uniref:Probable disease resistance protein At4g19060 n=1 Tax=Vigna radiata var. radiata TaxID=3916 RepID=A0A1S3VIN5_VIGRR|nr:probable disease resistance protein At4g19060 [Vigna radiata var. radiata]